MLRKELNIYKQKDRCWERKRKNRAFCTGKSTLTATHGCSDVVLKRRINTTQNASSLPHNTETTLEELLNRWFEIHKPLCKEATSHRYNFLIQRHILPELGSLRLTSIDTHTINHFLEQKQKSGGLGNGKTLSPTYVRSIAVVLQSALQYASAEGLCPPLGKIHKPALQKKESAILSAEEQRRLEATLNPLENGTALGVLLSLYGGLRAGEVCALAWDDVNLEKGVMQICHTVIRTKNPETGKICMSLDRPKTTASFRTVPIHPCLSPILAHVRQNTSSPFVISSTNTFVHPRTFAYRFRQLLKNSQLTLVNFHTLRHTFATRCVSAGMDVKTLSELLGHSNVSITLNTYVHSSLETKRQQMEKLVAFIPVCGQKVVQQS